MNRYGKTRSVKFGNVDIESMFPDVYLYHGTYRINEDSIRRKGVSPRVIDVDAVINSALTLVGEMFELTPDQMIDFVNSSYVKTARNRISESGFDKVYLSGEFDYAKSNARAGAEWMEYVILSASYIANASYYEKESNYSIQILDAEEVMERLFDKVYNRDVKDVESARDQLHHAQDVVSQLKREKEVVLGEAKKRINEQKRRALSSRYGDDAIVFEVVMPYSEFVRSLASNRSRKRVEEFVEQFDAWINGDDKNWFSRVGVDKKKVWEFFQEVHLKSVAPKYIGKGIIV